jgi:hypothetical protein
MYLYVIKIMLKDPFLGETLAHKLWDRYQLPVKIRIYVKSNALVITFCLLLKKFVKKLWKPFLFFIHLISNCLPQTLQISCLLTCMQSHKHFKWTYFMLPLQSHGVLWFCSLSSSRQIRNSFELLSQLLRIVFSLAVNIFLRVQYKLKAMIESKVNFKIFFNHYLYFAKLIDSYFIY